jgi:hypothetical protein
VDVGRVGRFGRECDAPRIAQQALREDLDLRRKRGGKQQALPRLREQRDEAGEFGGKAEGEQAVGFIEHDHGDCGE